MNPPDHSSSAFVSACRGEPHDRVPVWFMRQAAGRSPIPGHPGHRLDPAGHSQTDLAIGIALAVRRYGADAAILYSDIVTPVHAIGFGVDIAPGVGPVVEQPFRSADDLERLRPLEPELDTPYVIETVRGLVAELDVLLIAFAGTPCTVASYLLEDGRRARTSAPRP